MQVYHYIRDLAHIYHASMEAQAFLDLPLPGFTSTDAAEYKAVFPVLRTFELDSVIRSTLLDEKT